MGYDLLAAALFALLTPVVIVGFIVYWIVVAKDRAALGEAWATYARRRGLRFVEPNGEWPNRTAPSVRWEHADAELRLTTVGKESNVHTRLVVRPRAALLGTLVWICDGPGTGRVQQRARPAGFGDRILDRRVERALHALRQRDRVSLAHRRGRVVVDFPGGELNDARLDSARVLGNAIAERVASQLQAPLVSKPAA